MTSTLERYATSITSAGNLVAIAQRRHKYATAGRYLVTLCFGSWTTNMQCVMDDFGDLILVR